LIRVVNAWVIATIHPSSLQIKKLRTKSSAAANMSNCTMP
jgi:hypothetical protein